MKLDRRADGVLPAGTVAVREPRAFPEASTSPALTMTMRDEMVEFYAFVFCQRGFRQLGMTFEQFLTHVSAGGTTRPRRVLTGQPCAGGQWGVFTVAEIDMASTLLLRVRDSKGE